MDLHELEIKKQEIVSEANFEKLEYDPFMEIQQALTKKLKNLVKDGYITPYQSKGILPKENVRIPKLNVRIKPHKQNKCRPIIDFRFTLLYNLEKFIKTLLQDIPNSEYTIKNADDLISRLQKGEILSNYKLMSLDITSMYPSIKKSLCNYGVSDYLKDLIIFTLNNNYFTVNKDFYRQANGISMGSVIGPKLAEIYMLDVDKMLSELTGIKFFARTTNIDQRNKEIVNTHRKYILNGYPRKLLTKWYNRFLKNRFKVKQRPEIKQLAPSQNNRLSELMIVRSTNNKKDLLEEDGVVYRLECTCNNPSYYVGETKRKLKIRLSEHLAS
ncbi:uncharacterized protein, partial [Centruroides vittatus]|uniref:uncharacterized protein n=1 Tax=Centruroides vittatus TaxID=120091 RepID=UPI003510B291